jgi:galactokinase
VEIYNRKYSTRHSFLRDIADENPTTARAELFARVASATQNDPEGIYLLERFKQFYFEDREIIPQTVTAWIRSDLAAIGNLIDRSHRNSRRYLRNIVEEVDFLQHSARDHGALAASGFGAGFGGSVYAIIPRRQAEGFLRQWKAGYSLRFPQAARNSVFFLSRPGGAACSLPRIWE